MRTLTLTAIALLALVATPRADSLPSTDLTLEERVTALEIWESAMTEANSHQFDTLQKGSLP